MQLPSSVTSRTSRPACAVTYSTAIPLRQHRSRQLLPANSKPLVQHRRARTCIVPRAQAIQTDVQTDDKFRLRHSVSVNNFDIKGDLDEVFEYAADFSHISGWDSGTTGSHLRESSNRAAFKKGDTIALMTVLFGVKSSTVYQLLDIDQPNKVVFFGISRFHESTDTVTFKRKPGQEGVVQVEYTTDIELVRWYKWFQPFLGFAMAKLAKEAVEGMQKKLQGMSEKGKLKDKAATAAA